MKLQAKDIKFICGKISSAVDTSSRSVLTDVLQLQVENKILKISVTNQEYFVEISCKVDTDEKFNATVEAMLFINLIEKITTETIQLSINGNTLIVKGNGTYKLPLIFNEDKMLEVPKINIVNVTNQFSLSSNILRSLITYNSKELLKGTSFNPIQKLYYMDDKGALTFTSGACINTFSLSQEVALLLTDKIVKLFGLFDADSLINFEFGVDEISKDISQTKVKFSTKDISITSIINNDADMLKSFPVAAIRDRLNADYDYSIKASKNSILQALDRLSLFPSTSKLFHGILFDIHADKIVLSDISRENSEEISLLSTDSSIDEKYSMVVDLDVLKLTLATQMDADVVIKFGNKQAIVLSNNNINVIMPEIIES